jgi:hypothetical protein
MRLGLKAHSVQLLSPQPELLRVAAEGEGAG